MAIVKAHGGGYKFKGDWTNNGGTHFHIGDYYDNNSQFYSSRIQFSWSTENGEGKPIVVKSATLKLYCDNNDDDTYADIYINSVKTESKKAISNTGNSWTSISLNEDSCKALSKLNNGNSFYIILDGTSVQPKLGNRYKGYSQTNKPYLDISWVYGASSGKVSGSDFYDNINLTVSPLSSSYTHSIDWQLKKYNKDEYVSIKTISQSSGSTFSITYSDVLAVESISTYFSSTSKTTSGKVIITTYDGSTRMGESDYTFDVNLSGDALIKMSSSSFTAVHSEKILYKGTSHFLIDYSYLKYIVTFQSKTGANITKVIPSFSGGVVSNRGTLVPVSGKIEDTLNVAISKKEKISYSFLVTDSRNMTYTITGDCVSENSISKYSPPIITGGFYRSEESGTESKQGTYLNSNLKVTGENILSNKLNSLTIKIVNKNKNSTTSYICLNASGTKQDTGNTRLNNKISLSSSNIFSIASSGYINSLEGEDNLTITVSCKDSIWNGTISSTFSVPSLNYILYFKKGGEGLAFGGSSLLEDQKVVRSYWDLILQNRLILNEKYPLDVQYGGTGVKSIKGIWDSVVKPGGTIDGELIFNKKLLQKGDLWVQNSVLYPQINFIPKRDEVTNRLGTIYLFSRNNDTANDITRSQFNFRQFCFNPDGKTVYKDDYDTFSLPITGSISSAGSHGAKYYKIFTEKEYCYYPGDTENIHGLFYGYITAGKTLVGLTIPLRKDLSKVNSFTVTAFHASMRSGDGYLLGGSSDTVQNYLPYVRATHVNKIDNSLVIYLVKSSKFAVINNSVIQCDTGIYMTDSESSIQLTDQCLKITFS